MARSTSSRSHTTKASGAGAKRPVRQALPKSPSGIRGLDEITDGGLPKGRPTLICGGAGAGKTLLAIEFLVRGATEYNEPGVFAAFEETPEELAANVASLGFDLPTLVAQKKLTIDYIHIERSEIEETGEYDLEGLFVRLGYAIDSIGARRVVLDTVESLFAGLPNELLLRAELRRLFRWLKDRGVTAIITGERGERQFTRYGLEEYVSDCVILLDSRIIDEIATRRLRIAKYRGSAHGTNEYPFLIDERGISILPITSLGLDYKVVTARISSGIGGIDAMLGGKGYFRASSIFISGPAGTGKTTFAAACALAACAAGKKVLYFAFEESGQQFVRNMKSIGMDFSGSVKSGALRIHASRPSVFGLEMHLVNIHNMVAEVKPDLVIIDPIGNLGYVGESLAVRSMLTRMIDFLKMNGATAVFTSLVGGGDIRESGATAISSLMDTWISLDSLVIGGRRARTVTIIKSRGMAHSGDVREFVMTNHGVDILERLVESGRTAWRQDA